MIVVDVIYVRDRGDSTQYFAYLVVALYLQVVTVKSIGGEICIAAVKNLDRPQRKDQNR